jgi:hypothetical protein
MEKENTVPLASKPTMQPSQSSSPVKLQQLPPTGIKPPTELSWLGNMGDNWRFFKQKFNIYMTASRSINEDSAFQVAVLLNLVGDRALKIYNNFTYEQGQSCEDIKVVLKKFDDYFLPATNVTYERHNFFLREQKVDEPIDHYVTDLRDLCATCNFGTLTDDMIRDRVILGIRDMTIKDRLLRTKDLDLSKAMEICRAAERTRTQLAGICHSESDKHQTVNRVSVGKGKKHSQHSSSYAPKVDNGAKSSGSSYHKKQFKKVCSKCGYV